MIIPQPEHIPGQDAMIDAGNPWLASSRDADRLEDCKTAADSILSEAFAAIEADRTVLYPWSTLYANCFGMSIVDGGIVLSATAMGIDLKCPLSELADAVTDLGQRLKQLAAARVREGK